MNRLAPISLSLFFLLFLAAPMASAQDESTSSTPLTFPRALVTDDARVVVHEPQIDTWEGFEKVTGRIAVEVTPSGESDAVIGVAEFTANTEANLEKRVVAVDGFAIAATSFPVGDDKRRNQLDEFVRGAVKGKTQYIPLDVVLSYIAPEAKIQQEEGLSFEPPPIFYSSTPASLLMTDGEPMLAPLDDLRLKYVVNTNWDLFRYKDKEWYLRFDKRWLKAKTLDGPWKFDKSLPGDFKKLPDDGNWVEVKTAIPPSKGSKDVPTIFVSDRPAELIITEGNPTFSTVGAAGLEYIYDTESDIFRLEGKLYYLVSGRWFSALTLRGPWTHVTELPAEFATIPADHAKAHVLAAVSGTEEARLAVLEASIPRKATISRDAGKEVFVYYQGDPVFELIPETEVERAVNSASDVLAYNGVYYLCKDAVWYTSAAATGPWAVADTIPAAIYSIPASSSSYHVTHVHVYESDDDSVSTSYTSGYFGVHVGFGIAMYGSGWYYPPYYGYGSYYGYSYYPYYYPYPYSYGSSAWYNANTGMYGRSGSYYGPYGGYGRGASYNPETGAYARGAAVWDGNEIAGSGYAYNPRTGTGIATNRYANEHGGWGESLITQNDKWIQTRSEWNDYSRQTEFLTSGGASGQLNRRQAGDTVIRSGDIQRGGQSISTGSVRGDQGTAIGVETGAGTRAGLGRSTDGELYAGKDGQVYRRSEDGWYQNGDDGWNRVELSEERAGQVDRAREQVSNRWQSTDTLSNRGSYDSRSNRDAWSSSRRDELNRSYNARNSGHDRYNRRSNVSAGARQSPRGGQRQRRRR